MTTLSDKAIGDIVKVNVNGEARDFIIVHQGLPSNMYDTSCDGVWLLMKDIYETRAWDSTDDDYKNSDIHAYLNDTFLNLFDGNAKETIKQAIIPYHNGMGETGSVASGANGLSVKIFLLGGYEVGWSRYTNQHFPVDGVKLSYFLSGDSTSANNTRVANYNGSATFWWLRSPSTGGIDRSWFVGNKGNWDTCQTYESCKTARGVRPAFILPTDLKVDDSGNVMFNTAPTITSSTISGSDLGEISEPINFAYIVDDPDGNTVTVTEYLDDVQIRTYTATLGAENKFETVSDPVLFQKILNGQHTLKIIANDTRDDSEPYVVAFNKQVRTAVISLANPLPADDVIRAAVVSVTGVIPRDATLEVLVTNNALDENPVWENMTQDFEKKINHVFKNTAAANGFAFNFRVTATRGASGEQGFIEKIGGAFE